jgi:hypothetical protein
MRSRLRALLALLPLAALLRCDRQTDRVTDICEALEGCTDFGGETWGSCRSELNDAVRDGRISRVGLTRCASCIGSHEFLDARQDACEERPCENCASLLENRDCDEACAEVDFARRSRTSSQMRRAMCRVIDESCAVQGASVCEAALGRLYQDCSGIGGCSATAGGGATSNAGSSGAGAGGASATSGASGGGLAGAAPECSDETTNAADAPTVTAPDDCVALDLSRALSLDATVHECWKCTESVRKSFAGNDPEGRPQRCAAVVDNCLASCNLVRPANAVLTPAAAALSLCSLSTRCKSSPTEDGRNFESTLIHCTGGSGAAAGASGQGGNGGGGAGGGGAPAEGGLGGEGGAAGETNSNPVEAHTSCFDDRARCTSLDFVARASLCETCARGQDCSYVFRECRRYCEVDR